MPSVAFPFGASPPVALMLGALPPVVLMLGSIASVTRNIANELALVGLPLRELSLPWQSPSSHTTSIIRTILQISFPYLYCVQTDPSIASGTCIYAGHPMPRYRSSTLVLASMEKQELHSDRGKRL
jgi:hypothetical protein